MMRFKSLFWALLLLLAPTALLAQDQLPEESESIYTILKDIKGDQLEGYLRLYPNEVIVSTKDDREKSIPLKTIESIKVEKMQGGIPGADASGGESYYLVRLRNSQEIFLLKKKYTFSLNTSAGVLTRTLDPGVAHDLSRKDSSSVAKSKGEQPLIRGESVVLSLEIKF
jgi:hypothetical protein